MWRYCIFIFLVLVQVSVGLAQPVQKLSEEESIDLTLKQMTLEEKVGQLFMAAFRREEGNPVTAVTPAVQEALKQYHLGGVILFAENFTNIGQTVKLTAELQQAAGSIPLLIAVDQEGGRVNRFHFGTELPGNMALGASGNPGNAYLAGNLVGTELAALGINTNLAPVLDVNSNQDNPVIGIRSFGADSQKVSKMGQEYIRGLHSGGVLAAVKHFPGHGDTSVDSHLGLPIVWYEKSRLHEVELKPFYENRSSADMVMVAHVAFPALDEVKAVSQKDGQPVFLPATLSHKIITELLRQELGYDGVVITDALEMKAITEHFGPEEAVVRALQAGTDILLMPSDLHKAYEGVLEAVKTGAISEERIEQSVKRILRVKSRCANQENYSEAARLSKARTVVGSREHKEKETKLATEAVTLLKNEGKVLPLSTQETHKLVLAAPRSEWVQVMEEALLSQLKTGREEEITGLSYGQLSELTGAQKSLIDESDYVILATYSSNLATRTPGKSPSASFAASLIDYAARAGKRTIVLALGTPYDILYLQKGNAYLAVYGANEANIQAGMAAIFGSMKLSGKLPVPIEQQGHILFHMGYGMDY